MTLHSLIAASFFVPAFLFGGSLAICQRGAVPARDARGQLGSEPAWFAAPAEGTTRGLGDSAEYLGQEASGGVLVLTASNGFFDRGIRAKGESDSPDVGNGKKGRGTLIAGDYGHLTGWTDPEQTLRWHFWVEQPGAVAVALRLAPDVKSTGATVELTLGGESRRVAVGGEIPVTFDLKATGKHTLLLRADIQTGEVAGDLRGVELRGPAIAGARLLRARWRPAAVHGGYRASTLESTDMWVMASRSDCAYTSYSPITTPFGYFGVSFGADQRGGPGCNFSMWSKGDLPLEHQPRLLALGSPGADFSGFGHEGTGVKPRGWNPFAHRPEEIVLALRREREGKMDTYYGYFLDGAREWRLYAVGRKWSDKSKPMWPGSFVEVPGPPDRQRSGDQVRTVLRKGWARSAQGEWHRLDVLKAGKSRRQNKRWGKNDAGWFTFQMGGMEHYSGEKRDVRLTEEQREEALPDYLLGAKAEGLTRLPAKFGAIEVRPNSGEATLTFDLQEVGEDASAVVYFGKKDCLAFAPRELHGTERRATALQEGGTWDHSVSMARAGLGVNSVTLTALEPGATYYFRILVTSERGRMWTFETQRFTAAAR